MPRSINPATGETIAEYPYLADDTIEPKILAAARAQREWAAASFDERERVVRALAAGLRAEADALARTITLEMGKPIGEARAEVDKCAWGCEYFAEHGAAFLADLPVDTGAASSVVTFRPLGLVLAIMPWNFPLWQFFRFGAPALMAGNGVLLKHAENTWGCARAIERLARSAGLPSALVSRLDIAVDRVERVIAHDDVAAVTLTGSTRAGRSVASVAGRHLKPCVLELGGSDPYVVLSDADAERAAEICVTARMVNGGQSCIAAKRFVVSATVHAPFTEAVVEAMRGYTPGDPLEEGTRLGPLARPDLRDNLQRQVRKSVEAGARLLLGGEAPSGAGNFYPATVMDAVPADSPAAAEETFGPAAAIQRATDDDDALRLANETPYGLGAAVFTSDAARGEAIARDVLAAGCCAVNGFVKSDPRLPFGGIKQSGHGRELGPHGILEFVNVKSVVVG